MLLTRAASLLALLGLMLVAGCVVTLERATDAGEEADATDAESAESVDRSLLPKQELTENLLYEFLLAEIAGQRGNTAVAAQAYVDLAKRTRDPRIARRATEIALYARMNSAAIEAASIWHETEPGSTRALQALSGLLVAVGRYDEALPNLRKLLASSATDPANGFTQLTRTLANAHDKQAALKLLTTLAADYPSLPEAHYAVAQSAAGAGEDRLALEEVRRARQLRPDWEAAVLLESQLLQKVSVDQAASVLADFLQRYPAARETRLAYARMLVTQKRFPEARAEFQRLTTGAPDNTEMRFAVALLSLQLKDYDAAESVLTGLLASPHRDKDGVRMYLGQIAEERKNLPEALRWYGEVGEGEHYVQAQIRYAQVLARQGKLDAARRHLQEAAAKNSQQRVVLILAEAQILREANRPKEAFDLVGQALERMPNNPELPRLRHAGREGRAGGHSGGVASQADQIREHAHAYNALSCSFTDRNMRLPKRQLIEKRCSSPPDFFIMDSVGGAAGWEPPGCAPATCGGRSPASPIRKSRRTSAKCFGCSAGATKAERVWNDAAGRARTTKRSSVPSSA
jgi:tetratricopeptide (TPR) repeat protein